MSRRIGRLWNRREALVVGASAFGLTVPGVLRAATPKPDPNPGAASQARRAGAPAKSVIILYLNGGPSQLDMWDLKPDAPSEVRGSFRPISTNVPGTQISEHLPRMARLADKYTIVRSMTHDETDHLRAGYWVMTGGRLTRPITAFSGVERNDHPHAGAVVSKWRPSDGMPSFVVLPEFVSPRGVPRPGQHAGFLGSTCDPYAVLSDPNLPDYNPGPIVGDLQISPLRVQKRRSLLSQIENASPLSEQAIDARDLVGFRERAFDLVTSQTTRDAFDVTREARKTRERYGRHIFGQSTLVARRLVESGVRVVQVNFVRRDNGRGGQGYDSHSSPPYPPHLPWAKKELLPPTDVAFAALIEDLDERGMLEETVVVLMGEFGRTPRFNSNGGRDHWPGCYSLVLAGGGFAPGGVYGASDSMAATPTRDPVTPDDLLATVYHLLGIDHRSIIEDLGGRPHVLVDGEPVRGLLA